jgi:hypothetical protein
LQKVLEAAPSTFDMYRAMERYEQQTKNDENFAVRRLHAPSQHKTLQGKLSLN